LRLFDLIGGDLSEVLGNLTMKETEVTGLTCDSRKVAAGFVFAALPGSSVDGRTFMDQAVKRGAVAVLAPDGTDGGGAVPIWTSANPRRSYAQMAARFYGAQPSTIAAVTGTNGKTSVVSFTRQIWSTLGFKAASMGTLGINGADFNIPEGLTTPDPVDLHQRLAELRSSGIEKLAMEASSHGLDQYRLDGVTVSLAGFTNLSRDHLDYHGSMDDYLEAKLRLFSEVHSADGVAVLNADDEAYPSFSKTARGQVISYGWRAADIRIEKIEATAVGQYLTLNVMGHSYSVNLAFAGAFQVENALCALGLVLADGADAEHATLALENLEVVPGRLQHVADIANGAAVYVDYAHTPDALATVLAAMRPHASGKLCLVFGCGGDRDMGKRLQMGQVAYELADDVIITDDNPRSEEPSLIRAQALVGCPNAVDVGDRAKAIDLAINRLQTGDVLIVAGKGPETGQTIKGEVKPFNDADEIRRAVQESKI
jgi:UDP-N-acetylmuramoyl-L-alanyl-D-glutamate--2,6-diaminopimelate ligase